MATMAAKCCPEGAHAAMGRTEARPALPLLRRAPLVVKAEIGLTCVRIVSAPGTSDTSATLGTVWARCGQTSGTEVAKLLLM
ncbi:hypothetical protein K504DRAFT_121754 [Pleomassaria siparia CBS 279.74]|uniref:Uncharacterized protein n=1 Tax=Pleomassaria siparia CBS 279.74 TaxID=1314801 RepID=A0A6G1JWI4_9PLEO|nr:hypothetical protein K504DRAFT_121754 [Pleomassaria siparia CBS 279.74]